MANPETSTTPSKGEGNYDTCGVACGTLGCKKTCCKENTPAHQAYGIHACGDHK
jgi:hypothetical protein